jgi:hypothetical protein
MAVVWQRLASATLPDGNNPRRIDGGDGQGPKRNCLQQSRLRSTTGTADFPRGVGIRFAFTAKRQSDHS